MTKPATTAKPKKPAVVAAPPASDLPLTSAIVDGVEYPWYFLDFEWAGQPVSMAPERELWDIAKGEHGHPKPKSAKLRREYERNLELASQAYLIHTQFVIKDKAFNSVPFDHWNKGQQKIYHAKTWQEKNGLPVRIIVLKPRQTGVSTQISAFCTCPVVTRENQSAACITDKRSHTQNIFGMQVQFYQALANSLPPNEVPQLQRCTQRKEDGELVLGAHLRNMQRAKKQSQEEQEAKGPILNSKIMTFTAKAVGREHSYTVGILHGSEVPYWGDNAPDIWLGFAQSVPYRVGTMMFIEGTAHGAGDWFNCQWDNAELGLSDFVPVFFGWQDFPWSWDHESQKWVREYSRELPLENRSDEGRAHYQQLLNDKEREMQARFGLTLEQIHWRRAKIITDCNGDERQFQQEFPSTAAEAFIGGGSNVFPPVVVEYYLEQTAPQEPANVPVWQGNFSWHQEKPVLWEARPDGYTRIWRKPKPGDRYVIGVDTAPGENPKSDFNAAKILRIPTNPDEAIEEAAVCSCNGGLQVFCEQVACLYHVFGQPLTIIEIGGAGNGNSVQIELRDKYEVFNLYRRRIEDKAGNLMQMKHGFASNGKTKSHMVYVGKKYLGELTSVRLHDRTTVLEASHYVNKPEGKVRFGPSKLGDHDDNLDALLLGLVAYESQQWSESRSVQLWDGTSGSDPTLGQQQRVSYREYPKALPGAMNNGLPAWVDPSVGNCF